jgi:2,3-bisphosphoglycerate-dependent phosphoglycerate mutase
MGGDHPGLLVAVRHGCSIWNAADRFTGSADVDLAPEGQREAMEAGLILREANVQPTLLLTSTLRRARFTAEIISEACEWSPRYAATAALDERDHGVLEGLTHQEAEERFGTERVRAWRRTGTGGPPRGESFADVLTRVERAWATLVQPELDADRTVVVVGHGTSVRCLLVAAGGSIERASRFEVPRAQPALIRRPNGRWEPLLRGFWRIDGERVTLEEAIRRTRRY